MQKVKMVKRNKNGLLVSAMVLALGYFGAFSYALILGLGSLIFVVVDVLADSIIVKS